MKKLYFILFLLISSSTLFSQQSYYDGIDFNSLTGEQIKSALITRITSTHTNELDYTPDVWEASKITDEDPVINTNVLLFYGYDDSDGDYITDRTRSKTLNGGTQGTDWNREHVFPNGSASPNLDEDGRNGPPYADVHNLRPSDVKMNNNRGSLSFAVKSGSDFAGPVSGGWYPGDEWKGDAARIVMYMYLRYGNRCLPSFATNGTQNAIDSNMIDLLLKWNYEDPVSSIEDSRNNYHDSNATYAQGNRNPFIDEPYLANMIWGVPPGQTAATDRWNLLSTQDHNLASLKIYPNPVKNDFVYFSTTQDLDVIIYNVLGKQVKIEKVSSNKDYVDISNLNKGIYLVRLKSEHGEVTKKLIKQ